MKRLFNTGPYNQASIRMLDTMGDRGSNRPPFDYRHAVKAYRSWVYAASHINATAVAATPLRLFVRSKAETKTMWRTRPVTKSRMAYMCGDMPGDVSPSRNVMTKVMDLGDDFEEVTELHPIIELLQKANGVYNGFDLTVLRTLYQELTGNAYLHPICDEATGVPVELWPMPSQWMQVIPSRENFIDGYLYGRTDVEALRFERNEVIHFKRPNPDNLFYGLGKVEAAYGTVQSNVAVHEMDLAMFENNARPDYAVVVNGPSRRNDLDMFEQHVSERLKGTRKSGQFLAVSGDVKFEPLNFPPKDVGGREEIVEEIAAVFGVPVSMLKANDPNLASATAGFGQWRESTILPLLRMDEDVLNQILLPMFGIEDDAVLCYDNPVPADKEYELRQRQAAVQGGWQTLNEARLEQGMPQSDNELADELLMNGMPLGQQPSPFGASPFGGPPMPGMPQAPAPELPQEPQEEQEPAPVQQSEISEKLALNGAQIASIVEVLQNISAGIIAREAGIEVIVATGIGRDEANSMVEAQKVEAKPVEVESPPNEKATLPAPEEIAGELYDTPEEADLRAEQLGGQGHHVHETNQGPKYMPFDDMDDYTEATGITHEKNCGIGSEGFEPGNDCASGDGSGSSEAGKEKQPEKSEDVEVDDKITGRGDYGSEAEVKLVNDSYLEGKLVDTDGEVTDFGDNAYFEDDEANVIAGTYQTDGYKQVAAYQRGEVPGEVQFLDDTINGLMDFELEPEEAAVRLRGAYNYIGSGIADLSSNAITELELSVNKIMKDALAANARASDEDDIMDIHMESVDKLASAANKAKKQIEKAYDSAMFAFDDATNNDITKSGKPITVYRGCGRTELKMFDEIFAGGNGIGKTVTLTSTTSTSVSKYQASAFTASFIEGNKFFPRRSQIVTRFKAKTGAAFRGFRAAQKSGPIGNEREVLLPKGKSYKITGITQGSGTFIIDMEEID